MDIALRLGYAALSHIFLIGENVHGTTHGCDQKSYFQLHNLIFERTFHSLASSFLFISPLPHMQDAML
jgi:hypothetical protein